MLPLNSALNISVSMYFFFCFPKTLLSDFKKRAKKHTDIYLCYAIILYIGAANYGPPPAFVHNVLLEHTHNHLFTYGLRLLLPYNNKVEWW